MYAFWPTVFKFSQKMKTRYKTRWEINMLDIYSNIISSSFEVRVQMYYFCFYQLLIFYENSGKSKCKFQRSFWVINAE